MLRAQLHRQSHTTGSRAAQSRLHNLVVFSVAGQRLAARTEEIGGVLPWPGTTPVPSDTPFVTSLIRYEDSCLPVFDLAARLQGTMRDTHSLCLIVKHVDGPLAIRIDAEVPSLHAVPRSDVQYQSGLDPDLAGSCVAAGQQLPLINLATLGVASRRPA